MNIWRLDSLNLIHNNINFSNFMIDADADKNILIIIDLNSYWLNGESLKEVG